MTAGLLDTSVVIDIDLPEVSAAIPGEMAISAITMAELTAGPHLTSDRDEAARRQAHVQLVTAAFEPVPFDAAAARSYGLVIAAISDAGRSHRGRVADLLIAAVAHSRGFNVYTRNPEDFAGLDRLLAVHGI